MGFGFRQAFVDDAEQCRRPERLAQAARRAEPERHSQEVGAAQFWVGKAYPEIAISGTAGAWSWNILINSKPRICGMKTSTIIKSNVELSSATRAAGTAIGDRDLKAIALEPGANGEANMRIIVHNQNASHNGFSRRI